VIIGVLAVVAVGGWTAFGVVQGNHNKCERGDIIVEYYGTNEITVECKCTHEISFNPEIIVECNCTPEVTVIVECNCKPEAVECKCDDKKHKGKHHHKKKPELPPELAIVDIHAHISIENNEATVVINIEYDDGTSEQLVFQLENGVPFMEIFGDYTVEALFSVSGFNIVSTCNVYKN